MSFYGSFAGGGVGGGSGSGGGRNNKNDDGGAAAAAVAGESAAAEAATAATTRSPSSRKKKRRQSLTSSDSQRHVYDSLFKRGGGGGGTTTTGATSNLRQRRKPQPQPQPQQQQQQQPEIDDDVEIAPLLDRRRDGAAASAAGATGTSPTKPPHPPDPSATRYRHSFAYRVLNPHSTERPARLYKAFITATILFDLLMFVLASDESIYDRHSTVFYVCEGVVSTIFLVEYVTRMVVVVEQKKYRSMPAWKARLEYSCTFSAVVDLLATLPFFVEIPTRLELPTLTWLRVRVPTPNVQESVNQRRTDIDWKNGRLPDIVRRLT